MASDTEAEDNITRLLTHLKSDALAARLVGARRNPPEGESSKAMKAIIAERLEQAKAEFDGHAD